jgi:hypothetical protein
VTAFLICAAAWAQEPPPQEPPPQPAAPYTPPDWSDRKSVFVKHLFGLQAIWETVPGTAFDTARNFPHQWGRGPRGIGKRLGSQYAQFIVGETIEMGVSALHQEDPRYFRMPEKRFGRRLRHALVSTVVFRDVKGRKTIGLARLADIYGSWAIATLWNPPDQRNVVKIFGNGSLGLGLKASSNIFREFWPDVKRHFHH